MVDMIRDVYPHMADERKNTANEPQEPNKVAKEIQKDGK